MDAAAELDALIAEQRADDASDRIKGRRREVCATDLHHSHRIKIAGRTDGWLILLGAIAREGPWPILMHGATAWGANPAGARAHLPGQVCPGCGSLAEPRPGGTQDVATPIEPTEGCFICSATGAVPTQTPNHDADRVRKAGAARKSEVVLWRMSDCAKRAGITPAAVVRLRRLGRFPSPDAVQGDRHRWRPATIERWLEARPGQAAG